MSDSSFQDKVPLFISFDPCSALEGVDENLLKKSSGNRIIKASLLQDMSQNAAKSLLVCQTATPQTLGHESEWQEAV